MSRLASLASTIGNIFCSCLRVFCNVECSNGLMAGESERPGELTERWAAGTIPCMALWKSLALTLIVDTSNCSLSLDW